MGSVLLKSSILLTKKVITLPFHYIYMSVTEFFSFLQCHLDGEKLGAVFHAPCSDKCKSIMDVQRKEQLTRERGQKLQREYIKQAVHDVPQPEQRKVRLFSKKSNYTYSTMTKITINLND